MSLYCQIDFEFNHTSDKVLNLVSCAWEIEGKTKSIWLHKDAGRKIELRDILLDLNNQGYIFICFGVMSEARSFQALGLRPTDFKWICLYVSWRQLTNHCHKYQYGKQLIDGKVKRTFPPKPKYLRKEGVSGGQAEHNIGSALYKLLGIEIDTKHKTEMRDLIISTPDEFSERDERDIIGYNISDIVYLKQLFNKMIEAYSKLLNKEDFKKLKSDLLYQGEYSARTAIIESLGYPIDYESTKNFSNAVPSILFDIQSEINGLFPEVHPYQLNKRTWKYVWKQDKTREWVRDYCEKNEIAWDYDGDELPDGPMWQITDTGNISLSMEAFTRYFDFKHSYPSDNFGAQIVRFLKTKQNLNGFMPSKNSKRTFWDSIGNDGRSRPFLNIYGSQSGRNQPSSTGFIFLKAAWMRSLVQPKLGRAICSIDFKSEEFLIGGLLAGDMNMIRAYESGDVYLWFGKACGVIPKNATKKSHGELRDKFKQTTLAVQYKMGSFSLAKKLSADSGENIEEEEAQEYIDMFYDTFPDYGEYCDEVQEEYEDKGYLQNPCGWTMFGNNRNWRSVTNFPTQGAASSILRRAVKYTQEANLDVILTLHDALYVEFDSSDLGVVDILADCMVRAFRDIFTDKYRKFANVGLDSCIWSPDYPSKIEEIKTPNGLDVKRMKIYVDDRSIDEYEKFRKYFDYESLEDLL